MHIVFLVTFYVFTVSNEKLNLYLKVHQVKLLKLIDTTTVCETKASSVLLPILNLSFDKARGFN
uniref:Uncharacterized protein n=1 Tax=Octopus bimaculoides TaxID=37653 RepID=A0A0L8GK63_OCTBM